MHPPPTAFLIIDGRRWRTSDPSIPANLRQELVNELMAARRAVRDSKNQRAIRSSRRRVNEAKVALGERGHAWWLPPRTAATNTRIDAAIRALLRSRQADRSICPSDVARIVGGVTWRTLLPAVRDRAVRITKRGELEILRRGRVVTSRPTEGVLRYRLTEAGATRPPGPAANEPSVLPKARTSTQRSPRPSIRRSNRC